MWRAKSEKALPITHAAAPLLLYFFLVDVAVASTFCQKMDAWAAGKFTDSTTMPGSAYCEYTDEKRKIFTGTEWRLVKNKDMWCVWNIGSVSYDNWESKLRSEFKEFTANIIDSCTNIRPISVDDVDFEAKLENKSYPDTGISVFGESELNNFDDVELFIVLDFFLSEDFGTTTAPEDL